MSDIQRWAQGLLGMVDAIHGGYVTYADHVAALRQAEQRGREDEYQRLAMETAALIQQGQRDALAGAVERGLDFCQYHHRPQPYPACPSCTGVIAAIKGDEA